MCTLMYGWRHAEKKKKVKEERSKLISGLLIKAAENSDKSYFLDLIKHVLVHSRGFCVRWQLHTGFYGAHAVDT